MIKLLLALSLSFTAVPVITLQRTVCFGSCPAYKLTIYDDGKVEYEGKEFVKRKGKAEGQITKAELEKLIAEFERIDYLNLADNYTLESKNCPQGWTDNPTAVTSLNWKDKKKTIVHYHGCRGSDVLDQLTALEDKIDQVANTKRWIK
ncbi:MAG TPA: DUF6438 domain-containing protein [Pyrinomonadaceae bacterium]|nr:DUF6438 domain-containing protein [Pyrinomonadaceae bacterium]